jgi:hypothetical protein
MLAAVRQAGNLEAQVVVVVRVGAVLLLALAILHFLPLMAVLHLQQIQVNLRQIQEAVEVEIQLDRQVFWVGAAVVKPVQREIQEQTLMVHGLVVGAAVRVQD